MSTEDARAEKLAELRERIGQPQPAAQSRRMVWFGAVGDDVAYLQRRLETHGVYSVEHGDEPGHFGGATEQALRAFQQMNELRHDAICGPRTWDQIEQPPA